MTVKISKPAINVREELADLKKPTGIAGQAMLAAETPQEQFNLIGAGRRNLIINGGFDVWQRGTSFSNFNHAYSTDRWNLSAASVGSVIKASDSTYGNVCKITIGATDTNFIQPIENLNGFIANKDMTLSFWVKSSTITSARFVAYNGSNFTHDVAYNVSGSWTKVVLNFNTGSTYTAGTTFRLYLLRHTNTTGIIEFAQVQLEVGKVATPFEHRSYGEELALCQRYFWSLNSNGINNKYLGQGANYNTTACYAHFPFPTEMRSIPTLTPSDVTHFQVVENGSVKDASGVTLSGSSTNQGAVVLFSASVGQGNASLIRTDTNTNVYLWFDAEL